MSREASVQWARPIKQSVWERRFEQTFFAFLTAVLLLGLIATVKAHSWGWAALPLVGSACMAWWALFGHKRPETSAIRFQVKEEEGALRLSGLRNWSEAESLCNYFSKQGIYPAIDPPSGPPDCRVLLIGLTMERFASMLEGARIEPIERWQTA